MILSSLLGLVALLSGCEEPPKSQGGRTSTGANRSSASVPGSAVVSKTPGPQGLQKQPATRQTPEMAIPEADLQQEIMRALRDSWNVKGAKIATNAKQK